MGVRTGAQYLAGLADGREIYIGGECVSDVVDHPAFRRSAAELARVYDFQHAPALRPLLTFPSPSDGAAVSTSFLLARNAAEIDQRVQGESLRADLTYGLMGRLPDYMNAFVTDCAAISYLLGHRNPQFGEHAVRYWEMTRDRDLAMTHVLVDPHIDKTKGVAAQDAMRVIEETAEGLVVEGCKMLSTLAPLSDEVVIAPYMPRRPGEEAYTLICALPVATPGLKFVSRESYDSGRPIYDRPLSSRFDEQDSLAIFDRVLVPWERVFLYGDIETYNLTSPAYPGYLLLQAMCRATAKLRFAAGMCALVAETNGRSGIASGPREVASVAGLATLFGGVGRTAQGISAIRLFFPLVHQKAAEALRMIGSSALIMTPSAADFRNAALVPYLDRYLQGRDGLPAKDRVRVFKLAWDLLGEAFGSRSLLYEHFFAGDPINNRLLYWNLPKKIEAQAMAERMISEIVAHGDV